MTRAGRADPRPLTIRHDVRVGSAAAESVTAALGEAASRLQADFAARFPGIAIRFVPDDDGVYECEVLLEGGGWRSSYSAWDEVVVEDGIEKLIAHVAEDIADNWWPDEMTEPWPVCPRHSDHPLQPRFQRDGAYWVCRQDPSVAIRIGTLSSA